MLGFTSNNQNEVRLSLTQARLGKSGSGLAHLTYTPSSHFICFLPRVTFISFKLIYKEDDGLEIGAICYGVKEALRLRD